MSSSSICPAGKYNICVMPLNSYLFRLLMPATCCKLQQNFLYDIPAPSYNSLIILEVVMVLDRSGYGTNVGFGASLGVRTPRLLGALAGVLSPTSKPVALLMHFPVFLSLREPAGQRGFLGLGSDVEDEPAPLDSSSVSRCMLKSIRRVRPNRSDTTDIFVYWILRFIVLSLSFFKYNPFSGLCFCWFLVSFPIVCFYIFVPCCHPREQFVHVV